MSTRKYCQLAVLICFAWQITACDISKQGLGDNTPAYETENFNAKLMSGLLDPVSKAFLLVGKQGSIWRSGNGYDWTYSSTPVISTLRQVAADNKSGVLIAVGDENVILRSEDGGRVWLRTALDVPEGIDQKAIELKTIVHHAAGNVWLAAGTYNTILRSTDDGKNWQLISYVASDDRREILTLHVEPQTGDIFFGAQFGTIGRSKNAGVDWDIVQHDMEFPGNYIPHVVGFHSYGDTLIAAADEGRLLISKDHGDHWQLIKIPTGGYFTDSAYDPINKSIVLTTQNGEVAYSKDNGASWKLNAFKVKNWPSDDILLLAAIHYDSKTQSLLVMGNSGVVARSKDGGESWDANVIKSLFNLSVTSVLHDSMRNIFVATGLGGFILASQGLHDDVRAGWDLVRPGIDLYMRCILHLPDTDTFIIAGQLGGIWRSENDGHSWEFIEPKYPYPNQPPHFRDIILDPQTNALVAAGPDGSIMRSTDAGKTWTSVFQGVIHKGEAFTKILIDQKPRSLVAYEALYGSVYISKDGGINWTKEAVIPTNDRNIWYGAVSKKPGLLVVTGEKGIVSVSNDGGHSWTNANTGTNVDLYGVFVDEDTGVIFVTGQAGTILRSEDGEQWHAVHTGTEYALRRMIKEPKTGALLAFGQVGTILRSIDSGIKWQSIATPAVVELREAIIEPGSENVLITGRDGVLLRTTDGGLNWEKLDTRTSRHLRIAAANPGTGTIITAGESLVRMVRK